MDLTLAGPGFGLKRNQAPILTNTLARTMVLKRLYAYFFILSCVGVMLAVIGFLITMNNPLLYNLRSQTTGCITVATMNRNGTFHIEYAYWVDGKPHVNSEDTRDDSKTAGRPVNVVYMVQNPGSATIRYSKLRASRDIAVCVGLAFFVFGILMMRVVASRSRAIVSIQSAHEAEADH